MVEHQSVFTIYCEFYTSKKWISPKEYLDEHRFSLAVPAPPDRICCHGGHLPSTNADSRIDGLLQSRRLERHGGGFNRSGWGRRYTFGRFWKVPSGFESYKGERHRTQLHGKIFNDPAPKRQNRPYSKRLVTLISAQQGNCVSSCSRSDLRSNKDES